MPAQPHSAKRDRWPDPDRPREPRTPGPDPVFRLANRHFPRLVRTFAHNPDEGLALARALVDEMEAWIAEVEGRGSASKRPK